MTPSTKKLIILIGAAVLLVAVLLIVLFACGGSNDNPDESDSQSESSSNNLPQPSESPSDDSSDNGEPTEFHTNKADEPTESTTNKVEEPTESSTNKVEDPTESGTSKVEEPTEPGTKVDEPMNEVFEDANDTIYITHENVQARKSTVDHQTQKYVVLHKGESYQRTGKNGEWSRIVVDHIVCFVSNKYISTSPTTPPDESGTSTKPITPTEPTDFVECNETYYVSAYRLWLRTSPDTTSKTNIVYSAEIKQGQEFKAIAKNDKFIKIIYNDEVRYLCMIGSDGKTLLTTDYSSIKWVSESDKDTGTTTPSTPVTPDEPDDQPSK